MKYYLLSEAAKIMGIRQVTLRTYIHKGYLKATKRRGRNWWITEDTFTKLQERSRAFREMRANAKKN